MSGYRSKSSTPSPRRTRLCIEALEDRVVPSTIVEVIFSPDGSHVAELVSNGSSETVFENGKTVGGSFPSISQLQFSPAGNKLVFVTANAGDTSEEVFDNGHVVVRAFSKINSLQFSPDGTHLAFVGVTTTTNNLGVVNTTEQLFEDGHLVAGTFSAIEDVQFSPAGDNLAFVGLGAGGTTSQLFENGKALADGEGVQLPTGAYLRFSPDGKDLAYVALVGTNGAEQQVFENGAPIGPQFTAIVSSQAAESSATPDVLFSASGDNLAYVGQVGNDEAYELVENGSPVGPVFAGIANAQFSPTGTSLAFIGFSTAAPQVPEIFDNGTLLSDDANDSSAVIEFSPDGLHLAYELFQATGVQVGEDGSLLASGELFGSVQDLTFSPLGDHLVFAGFNAGDTSCQVFEDGSLVAGGATFGSLGQFFNGGPTAFAFSPDGAHLAFIGFNAGNTSCQVFEDGNVSAGGASFVTVRGGLHFSQVGDNLAFVGYSSDDACQVFENGTPLGGGATFVAVGTDGNNGAVTFSADGQHLAFIGITSVLLSGDPDSGPTAAQVFEDNAPVGPVFADVHQLQFSPVDDDLAFVGVNQGSNTFQVFLNSNPLGQAVSGILDSAFSDDGDALRFSSDGSQLLFTFIDNLTGAGGEETFTVLVPPVVTAVTPSAGSTKGGTVVSITGTHLAHASAVDFGSVEVTKFLSATNTAIRLAAPAGSAGSLDIRVATAGGTSTGNAASAFTYEGKPAVTQISPAAGPTGGGTTVTIIGTNLADAKVLFGSTAGVITSNTSTQIVAVSPPGTAGSVNVTVVTPVGTSARVTADQFTYDAPTITDITPATGPTTGGTTITITGTNLSNAKAVDFGNTAVTSFVSVSDTQLVVISPKGKAGVVKIRIVSGGSTSASSPADDFTFVLG